MKVNVAAADLNDDADDALDGHDDDRQAAVLCGHPGPVPKQKVGLWILNIYMEFMLCYAWYFPQNHPILYCLLSQQDRLLVSTLLYSIPLVKNLLTCSHWHLLYFTNWRGCGKIAKVWCIQIQIYSKFIPI